MSNLIIQPTAASFQNDVIDRSASVLVVAEFWAPWSINSRSLLIFFERLVREYNGRFLLAEIMQDDFPGISRGFGIQAIPTTLWFRGGVIVDRVVGMVPDVDLRQRIDRWATTP